MFFEDLFFLFSGQTYVFFDVRFLCYVVSVSEEEGHGKGVQYIGSGSLCGTMAKITEL